MGNVLNGLKPEKLWKNFEDICSIPHASKKEEKIIEFARQFGEKNGLETIVDKVGNVIIRKPATPGMENRKGVVLQGHLDMVPQKNSDNNHNFDTDPIRPRIDGEWVKATGTTLGADNGIGMAAAMAVLESKDLQHGPIEALLTVDEETGMTGAFELQPNILKGDILMNLDSEDEGELYIGCAGGVNTVAKFKYSNESVPANSVAYKISITGLKGGHSGIDISLGRGNSNKIINRLMWNAFRNHGLCLASIDGGSLRNAIPREAFAVVTVNKDKESSFLSYVKEYTNSVKLELARTDEGMNITVEKTDMPANIIDRKTTSNLLNAIYGCPNGVAAMSFDMIGLVETSNNLAIVKSENGVIRIDTLQRSSVNSAKDDLAAMIRSVFELAGAEVEHSGEYPGWKPNVDSPVLKTMKEVYNKKYGKVPEIKAIHAGLECGLLGKVYPNWDMISFGPTIRHPHSPDEKVNIASVQKFWDFLVETLKNVPVK